MNSSQPDTQTAHLQFSVMQLLLFTTVASLLFTIDRFAGTFVTALLLGLYIVNLFISILRFENYIVGGLVGTLLAWGILFFTVVFCALINEEGNGGALFAAMLIYPMFGYSTGSIRAALNSFCED